MTSAVLTRPEPIAQHSKAAMAANVVHHGTMVRVLTCGSVDDGKSTLIGRLLWDASDLPDDTRATIAASAGPDGVPDVSLLLDGLEAERAQGITIDIAWRYFDVARRRYVIIDCPGHEQYTRNMATGASQADIAIMLIDARQGIKQQTRRHAAILELVGIKQVILAVNKMDLVDWSEAKFRAIAREFKVIAEQAKFDRAVAIPVASRLGDNIASQSPHMPWYTGATLLTTLEETQVQINARRRAFRFPVQTVVRADKDFRGLAGTVTSGTISVGDRVIEVLSGKSARVTRIATFDGDKSSAIAGEAVNIAIDTDLDISRGGLLATPEHAPKPTRDFDARLVWLSDTPPGPGGLLLRTATDLAPIASLRISAKLDLSSLAKVKSTSCGPNDIADARISLGRPVAIDTFASDPATGHFVLIDALTGATVAGGVVSTILARQNHDADGAFRLTRAMLASTVCADIPKSEYGSAEFQRRAAEVAFLMSAAGVRVDLDLTDRDAGEEGGSGI